MRALFLLLLALLLGAGLLEGRNDVLAVGEHVYLLAGERQGGYLPCGCKFRGCQDEGLVVGHCLQVLYFLLVVEQDPAANA